MYMSVSALVIICPSAVIPQHKCGVIVYGSLFFSMKSCGVVVGIESIGTEILCILALQMQEN